MLNSIIRFTSKEDVADLIYNNNFMNIPLSDLIKQKINPGYVWSGYVKTSLEKKQ